MSMQKQAAATVFRVLDAMDAPHAGRILRLRLQEGETPTLRQLRGAQLRARSPKGEEQTLKVLRFALTGGRPSDTRFSRTGRVDLVVEEGNHGGPRVSARWTVTGPL